MFFLKSRQRWIISGAWGSVKDVKIPPHLNLKYPRFFFDGYNQTEGTPSDRIFIEKRMAHIPNEEKQMVCEEYERIYLSKCQNFRRKANEFLHKEAVKYRGLKK